MATRLDGFYYARWEGLNQSGGAGQGVLFLRDGRVYGGDNVSCILGEYGERAGGVVARVQVLPLVESYRSVTGVDNASWRLDDIRGSVPAGMLDLHYHLHLDAQRYQPEHHAISLDLIRIATF